MAEFQIAGRWIGDNHPPLIVAEIGINHEGSLDLALAMADAAIDAGAEIIKHQTHIIEDEMSNEAKLVIPGNAEVSIYEIMDRCALSEQDERRLGRDRNHFDRRAHGRRLIESVWALSYHFRALTVFDKCHSKAQLKTGNIC